MNCKTQASKCPLNTFFVSLRGVIVMILLSVNTIIYGTFLFLSAALLRIIPFKRIRHYGMAFLITVVAWWIAFNKGILWLSTRGKIKMRGQDTLNPKDWYLLISNHRSWFDILVITTTFNYKLPMFKFFMKKELIWTLPMAGLACYFLDFPMLSRHTPEEIKKNPALKGKDVENTRKVCNKLKEFPTTIISFAEGTRFTPAKSKRQQSPYQYLLKPKAGGIAIVLEEMKDYLSGIVNVTLLYPKNNLNLWHFASGNFSEIIVSYEVLPITLDLIGNYDENREFRVQLQQWLNQVWQRKDDLLKQLYDYENSHRNTP